MPKLTGHRLKGNVLQAVLDRIEAGKSNTEIFEVTGVWPETTRKMRLSLEYWGAPYPPIDTCVKHGRPLLLRDLHKQRLLEFLKGKPHAYIEEMKDFLYDELGILVSLQTIFRNLTNMNWSRKKASKL